MDLIWNLNKNGAWHVIFIDFFASDFPNPPLEVLSHVALPGSNHCRLTLGLPKDRRIRRYKIVKYSREMERHKWYTLWCLMTVMLENEVELQLVEIRAPQSSQLRPIKASTTVQAGRARKERQRGWWRINKLDTCMCGVVCDKVVCKDGVCVCGKVTCKRRCVTKQCERWRVTKLVCDKVGCVRNVLLQSWKMVCDKVVWQSCVCGPPEKM